MTTRVHTPLLLQMEAAECGAAALGIILAYYRRFVPLEVLRPLCGVSRDGTNALNLVRAAQHHGLQASGLRRTTLQGLKNLGFPLILFWNANHFVVLEGIDRQRIYLNDPAGGHRVLDPDTFQRSYSGIVIVCKPGDTFQPGGQRFALLPVLLERLRDSGSALIYLFVTSLFLLISGLLLPALLRSFVDDVLVSGRDWFAGVMLGMTVALGLRVGLLALQQALLLRLETFLSVRMTARFVWHLLHLPSDFFAQRTSGDLAQRTHLHDRLASLLAGELVTALFSVLLMAFYVVVMLTYDLLLTLLGVGFVVLSFAILHRVSNQRTSINQVLLQARAQLSGTLIDNLHSIETIKAAGAESLLFERWSTLNTRIINTEQQLGITTQTGLAVLPLLLALNTTLVLILGSSRVIDGAMTLGSLVAFQSLMFSFVQPVDQLAALGGQLQELRGDLQRLNDVLQYPAAPSAPLAQPGLTPGYLEIHGVSFHYNPLDKPLIAQFSLTVKPHQHVLITGVSGSGKSTLARLVAGMYTPHAGVVLLDQRPVTTMQHSIAMVDQTITLFRGTFRENLTLWDDEIPESALVRAARDACVEDLIQTRGGFDASIEDNGQDLSGGQRQCLEIARALVRDPVLLILDEATSALDTPTEQAIYQNLRWRGCTCLIISHRIIPAVDQIVTLERTDG